MWEAEGVGAVCLRVSSEVYKFVLRWRKLGGMLSVPFLCSTVDLFQDLAVTLRARAYCKYRNVVDIADRFCVLRLTRLD